MIHIRYGILSINNKQWRRGRKPPNNREEKMKKKITMEDFDNWLSECPVPYEQTCSGLNTTEYYSFDLIDCEMKSEEDDDE